MPLRRHTAVVALSLGLGACVIAPPPAPAPASSEPPAAAPQASAAERAGQGRFNATGNIPCAGAAGQPTRSCPYGVARGPGQGEASVVVTKPNGTTRAIFFQDGRPLSANSAQADGSAGWRFAWRKQGDLFLITFGPERFEIPEAVVLGG